MAADRDERLERAASFAGVADAYERARPGYPEAAARWLAGDEPCDVVDLGAGTGKLTRSLVALGHRVTAVEPLEAMLDQLRTAIPGAAAVLGSAESMPLPDASADVVTCAQAFHCSTTVRRFRRSRACFVPVDALRSSGTPATSASRGSPS